MSENGHEKVQKVESLGSALRAMHADKSALITEEALPNLENYTNVDDNKSRPTLHKLQGDKIPVDTQISVEIVTDRPKEKVTNAASSAFKFGWIQGVLVRCMLNIFGVMLFLRLSWVTGQAGIGLATVIILLSGVVTVLTTMSMSAICTNGEVKGGGAYYMISRILGPEVGGAIGILFSLANAVAAAMYVVGFAETVVQLLTENNVSITGNPLNDIRLIGCGTALLLLGIVVIGMEWEAKAQLFLLFILIVAILNFMVGTFIPPSKDQRSKGFVGYSGELFKTNFVPDFRNDEGFFSVFAVFFPAATGILAGANISGDLKDPQKAIPRGTFLAILITSIVYIIMVWMCGSVLLRDAAGPIAATVTSLTNDSSVWLNATESPLIIAVANCSQDGPRCPFGSINNNYAIGLASAFRPLILAGIFSATLSSALASLVSAPKVFQAVGKDRLFPGTHFFAKPYGKSGEPIRGYALTFVIAIAVTCIAELNVIAPIISNFFLMAYTLVNFSCFDVSLAETPGFRPAFKYYNKWLSLLGALLCLAVMFVINWWAALITFVVVGGLYFYIKQTKPGVNWGSSTQAHTYHDALTSCQKLSNVEEHVKNFRPQILVLAGNPRNRPNLVDFAACITKRQGLLVCGQVLEGEFSVHLNKLRSLSTYKWLKAQKVKAFYCNVASPDLRSGAQVLLEVCGLGKLRPNTLFLGYKTDWLTDDFENSERYYRIISDAFDLDYGVGILRVPEGFDLGRVADDEPMEDDYESDDNNDDEVFNTTEKKSKTEKNGKVTLVGVHNRAFSSDAGTNEKPQSSPVEEDWKTDKVTTSVGTDLKENRFRLPQTGTIDVWWLFDDGGLTLLIPYILSSRDTWKNCKLRIFCVGNTIHDERRIATLLQKFRIVYSKLTVITGLGRKPKAESLDEYENMMANWRLGPDNSNSETHWLDDDSENHENRRMTYRNLKLREHLLKKSKDASLIVMSLPVPKKTTSVGHYLSWLEILSKDLPPVLLLRGNQQNVLTFYS